MPTVTRGVVLYFAESCAAAIALIPVHVGTGQSVQPLFRSHRELEEPDLEEVDLGAAPPAVVFRPHREFEEPDLEEVDLGAASSAVVSFTQGAGGARSGGS